VLACRSIKYSTSIETALKSNMAVPYSVHRISAFFAHSGYAINQSLDRSQHKIKKRLFAVENLAHEHTKGLGHAKITKQKNPICSQPFAVIGQNFSGFNRAVAGSPIAARDNDE